MSPPDALREYEKIKPGAFSRMFTMADQAQAGEINSSQRAQEYQRRDTKRGQMLGAATSLIAMGLVSTPAVNESTLSVFWAQHGQTIVAG